MKSNRPPTRWLCTLLLVCLCGLPLLAGCVDGRPSTHELEHVVPAHWPTGLADAADKIEQRVAAIEQPANATQARAELLEIIEWLPEVAADTPIREASWVPIHEACAKIESLLKDSTEIGNARGEIQSLCDKLRVLQQQVNETDNPFGNAASTP